MLTALALTASFAHANSIGLDELPDQPASRSKSFTTAELRDALGDDIEVPEVLVPWNYERHGKPVKGRFYDEDGNVYTAGQVALILEECDACDQTMRRYERHQRAAMGWGIGAAAGALVFFPAFFVCEPVAIVHSVKANRALGVAVKDFNQRDAEAPAPKKVSRR